MITTGLKGLDAVINGLRSGDNVVWQIDDIKDYKGFVAPLARAARDAGEKVIYMRFAPHKPLLKKTDVSEIYDLDPAAGFEAFTTQVSNIIKEEGENAYYVFDCLSDLLSAWATDLMIGNFFMVTCPYLYELNTIAYFAILRNRHSFRTIARIRETTQLLIDVYSCGNEYYVHPLKVWNRYSPTMFLPHVRRNDDLTPVTDSARASSVLCYISRRGAESARRNLDNWDLLFMRAEELLSKGEKAEDKKKVFDTLSRVMIGRDKKILDLAAASLSLEDLLEIRSRMVGTGFIGGKTVGMLLSRNILSRDKVFDWKAVFEPHDSYYVGSDVYYSYIVENGWWRLRMRQKTKEGYFDAAAVLKEKMLHGAFPEEISEKFRQMIEYFGTSPIIVRSSSLLEDSYGNAFAGKYESVFLPNQGPPEQRYMQFVNAVRRIYASTMSEDALAYRRQRGLDMLDEQMALLVQRVSGSYHGHYFFPDIAGVGVSYNTYVWNEDMDPKAGMLRIVMGLGTRSVNRVEGDYPRIVALDDPLAKPHGGVNDLKRFSQHDVDLMNIKENTFETVSLESLAASDPGMKIERFAERCVRSDGNTVPGKDGGWVLTFDKLLAKGDMVPDMARMMKTLEKKYKCPVDIEFTINFTDEGEPKINLLQCRPLQTRGLGKKVDMPASVPRGSMLFGSEGYFFGGNISQPVRRIIYVHPQEYIDLGLSDKYAVARAVGRLNKEMGTRDDLPTMLLGPGRWGTTTPSLGVPVTFAEINNMVALGEIAFPGGNLMPELSFGTHFFQDLVETNIFYAAIFPEKANVVFNTKLLFSFKDIFKGILPGLERESRVISVYETAGRGLRLMSDIVSQKVVCFLEP